jgi:hypothetical protein
MTPVTSASAFMKVAEVLLTIDEQQLRQNHIRRRRKSYR